MGIAYQVLGKPGRDNALMVWVNSGNHLYRILLDCGENLLYHLTQSEVKSIDYLLLSHLHIDHIAGFDYFFRRNYTREEPIIIWGPEETASIIHNRLRGYKWNLVDQLPGSWYVTDITSSICKTYCYKTADSYRNEYFIKQDDFTGQIFDNNDFSIQSIILNHIIPTIGYSIVEKSSYNINKYELLKLNIPPGPWLEKIKDLSHADDESLTIAGQEYKIGYFRNLLLVKKLGEKVTYLTDFIYDEYTFENLINFVKDSDVLVCESQYLEKDGELAKVNYHLTAKQAADIAKAANVKRLVLFHISERYLTQKNYPEILNEAREIFPETYFSEKW